MRSKYSRLETKSLNSKERVIFEPYPKQQEYIEAVFSGQYSLLVYGGAMGGGKSYVNLAVLIMLARIYPRSKWCVIRESVPTLKKTTLETFRKLVPSNFLASYNQQEHIAHFRNGSQILFMAEDYANDKDFDRFKGLEVNGFLLEQIEELQEGLLDVCFIRAGRWSIPPTKDDPEPRQPDPLIMANMNPTLLWPKTKIYDPWVEGKLPKDWCYIPAKITDNPKLAQDEKYMSRLQNLDDMTRRRLIEGDWTAFAVDKPYLYNFRYESHVIDDYEPNPHLPILISFDFNIEPMTAIVSQKVSMMEGVTFDEIEVDNGSVEEVCEIILAKYPHFAGNIDVTGDATGRNREKVRRGNINAYRVIKEMLGLYDRNILVPTVNMEHKDSRVLCNSVLQHAQWRITQNCKKTIADCIHAQVDEHGNLMKTKDQGRHFFDNVRYTIHAFYPDFIKNPKKYR